MRALYEYLKESKEDILNGALKENVIERQRRKSQKGKWMKERRQLCIKES